MKTVKALFIKVVMLSAALVLMTAGPSRAVVYNLVAGTTNSTMPDGQVVPMWGFGLQGGQITVPGPTLSVKVNEKNLTVNLQNNLPVPVSIVIPGIPASSVTLRPVWTNAAGTIVSNGSRKAGDYTSRVRSFTIECPPGGTASYYWKNPMKAGTYMYMSGTNPALQVQMGLYGAVQRSTVANRAYDDTGSAFDRQISLLFSEIDPAIHTAVATGNYGPGKAVTSMVNYEPKYFLLNGRAYPNLATINPGNAGQKILIRFMNAGGKTHVPMLLNGQYMKLIAEDGNRYNYIQAGTSFPYAREQCTVELAAGKTIDAIITPAAAGKIPLFDRMLGVTNAGAYPGGMITTLNIAAP